MITWTLIGIKRSTCHVGQLICSNEAIEKLCRFEYAKCLVKINNDCELPNYIICGDNEPSVKIRYDWKPMICTHCKCFNHSTDDASAIKTSQIMKF